MSSLTSLRARKRAETWEALHEGAAGLALVHAGLAGVTIGEITTQAHVSTRTFFNYFETKEDAILGFKKPRIDDEVLADFTDSTDPLLTRVANFYFELLQRSRTTGAGRKRRLQLVQRHPELTNRQFTHFMQVETLVTSAVHDLLAAQEPNRPDNGHRAEALVQLSSAANRLALRHASPTSKDSDDRLSMHRELTQLREAFQTNT